MTRTDLDPTTLAASLRRMAGDGSVEWVHEPMQTCVLLDMADMLDELELWHRLTAGIKFSEYPMTQFRPKDLERENAKLKELARDYESLTATLCNERDCDGCPFDSELPVCEHMRLVACLGELGADE